MIEHLITDALGFRLEVIITVSDFEKFGEHRTYENSKGKVSSDAVHRLNIKSGLKAETLSGVAAHEVYHLFYSIRHLVTVYEETQAEVFGSLVEHIIKTSQKESCIDNYRATGFY